MQFDRGHGSRGQIDPADGVIVGVSDIERVAGRRQAARLVEPRHRGGTVAMALLAQAGYDEPAIAELKRNGVVR